MNTFHPPYYQTQDKLLYAMLEVMEGNPMPENLPKPPYYDVTCDLLYAVLNKLYANGSTVKKYESTITGDSGTTDFIIEHNLNLENVYISVRDIQDGLKEILVENFPEPSDPANKLIVRFGYAPIATQSFKILVIG